jgi:cytochrome c553
MTNDYNGAPSPFKRGNRRRVNPLWNGTIMRHISTLFTIIFLVLLSLDSSARVTGSCVSCHTMHNSQNNLWVADGGVPNPALLVANCIGCHTGQNNGINTTPYVFSTTPPQYMDTGTEPDSNTLAGGTFYWVSNLDDRRGHNVYGLAARDQILSLPPGGNGTFNSQLRCAGAMGCHGDRTITEQISAVKGSHHYKDHTIWQTGASLATSYRILDTIQGLGDPGYEYHPIDVRHNKYYGLDRASESETAVGTISSQCAQCHEDYHNGPSSLTPSGTVGTGVWLRHPTDFDMSNAISSTEYQLYNNSSSPGNNTYSVISPVATADTSTTLNTTIFSQANDAVVMCLSCHRAHGSPYSGALRWNYKAWPGGGYNGCAVCHTAKN